MEPRVIITRPLPGPGCPETERVIVVDASVKDYLRIVTALEGVLEGSK